jgi:2,3-dihydroxy-p-cumate/2,3-dihydroxybenzoate 3,4-dioxygenase
MIELLDLTYVRLGTQDLTRAEAFATTVLGLEVGYRHGGAVYLRSDLRAHSLCYFEGAPEEQIIGFEVADAAALTRAADRLEHMGVNVHEGTAAEAELRMVQRFIGFRDPTGNRVELVTRPALSAKRYFPTRDAGITGFNHVGLNSTDPVRDEAFWTQVCNARVSDRIGDIPLMRINAIHHTLALVQADRPGVQHINHQVQEVDDVMRSFYHLQAHKIPIVFGPGRHPTSGARFLYFRGPDGMVFEYSCGVGEIANEATHRPRQFVREPTSFCMWGTSPQGLIRNA